MQGVGLLIVLLVVVCTALDPAVYTSQTTINDNYKIYWGFEGEVFRLALIVNTTGWIGFGIGEITSGSMPGADFVTLEWINDTLVIHDRYAMAVGLPPIDSCEDWVLFHYSVLPTNQTEVEVYRRIETRDPQDRPLSSTGLTAILWAYGADKDKQLTYHSGRRGTFQVMFYPSSTPTTPPDEEHFTFELKMPAVQIPVKETTYMCYSLPVPKNDTDYHIVNILPVIDPATATYVHHFLVHICEHQNSSDNAADKYRTPQECSSPLGSLDQNCSGVLFVWAPGGPVFETPYEAGFLMGASKSAVKWLILEIHYNNRQLTPGLVDSSGVVITYTPQLRQYSAGILMLGDVLVSEYDIPPLTKSYHIETDCPSECTSKWTHDINVFADMLHMHQVGSMMWSTQKRQGVKMSGFLSRVEFWDFDFQNFPKISRVIERGDSINTHCIYDTSAINTSVRFGASSADEMCIEFIAYYPKLLSGAGNDYGFCGKFRGVYNNETGSLPNPNRNFATICGDLTFPDSMLFDNAGISVNNPVVSDPPGGATRLFGQLPSTCSAAPVLPTPPISPPDSTWKDYTMIGLGVGGGILFVVLIVSLLHRTMCQCKPDGYDRIIDGDELGKRRN